MARLVRILIQCIPSSSRARRWLAFAVVCFLLIVSGFWLHRWWVESEIDATVALVESKGGRVRLSWEHPPWMQGVLQPLGLQDTDWLRCRYSDVWLKSATLTKEELACIARLPGLYDLHLDDCSGVNDESVGMLSGANSLDALWLDGTAVTDAGLTLLAELPRLRRVNVEGTGVTAAGVSYFAARAAQRRDPNQRLVVICVSASKAQAVEPLGMHWVGLHADGTARIGFDLAVQARFRMDGIAVDNLRVGWFFHGAVGPVLSQRLDAVAVQASGSDFVFDLPLETGFALPGEHSASAWLISKQHPNAIVVYQLGVLKVSMKPVGEE